MSCDAKDTLKKIVDLQKNLVKFEQPRVIFPITSKVKSA